MTNAETIEKLNSALSNLIGAYEELQKENSELKEKIDTLEDDIEMLNLEKDDLNQNLDNYENTTKEDNSNITSMLGKIESLLNRNSKKVDKEDKIEENILVEEAEKTQNENEKKVEKIQSDTVSLYDKMEEVSTEKTNNNNNKLNANEIESLLNGFGR